MTTTEKTKTLQPVSRNPEFTPRYEYLAEVDEHGDGPCEAEPESVVWDLSFGSCLSFGPDLDGRLSVRLNLSDEALADTYVHRAVTEAQVIAFARYLLALTKGDDDIETIAVKLAETAAQFNERIEEKAEELAAPRIAEARQQVAEVMAELERVGEFHERRIRDLQAEFGRQIEARDKQIERLIAAAKTEGSR